MDLNFIVGGPQGGGIETAGMLLIRALASAGLEVFGAREYHSNIKGKHSYFNVRASDKAVRSIKYPVDVIGGLDPETLATHFLEVRRGGICVYDEALSGKALTRSPSMDPARLERLRATLLKEGIKDSVQGLREYLDGEGVKVFALPLSRVISDTLRGTTIPIERTMNTAITSAILTIVGLEKDFIYDAMNALFADKKEILEINKKVSDAVYEKLSGVEKLHVLPKVEKNRRLLVAGNDAVALGKLLGGLRFQTYYPITPAADESLVIEERNKIMDDEGRALGGPVVVQTEDEISAMAMAIGGALTGVRCATSTSGPGFSLMVEGLGWAGINEVPVVITYYQRGGPSTGLPTRHSQSDLLFSVFAGHGEFSRIVLASGDHREAAEDAAKCFNYAELYQVPVIHLLDKGLANAVATMPPLSITEIKRGVIAIDKEGGYKRFRFTENGISPRAFLGSHLQWYTGDEHDENGNICEDPQMRERMYRKRMEKRSKILREIPMEDKAIVYGPEKFDELLLTWGTTKGAVLDALDFVNGFGSRVGVLHLRLMEPFPAEDLGKILEEAKRITAIEGNFYGQLARLVKCECGKEVQGLVLKYNGRIISEDEVVYAYKQIREGKKRVVLVGGE